MVKPPKTTATAPPNPFAPNAEGLTAGAEDLDIRSLSGDRRHQLGCRPQHVLAIVEHQQQLLGREELGQRVDDAAKYRKNQYSRSCQQPEQRIFFT